MDFSKYSGMELIKIYGELLSEMREDKLIRSKNVTGDLGEYIVVDYYTKTKGLPKLQFAPPSTKNIDAIKMANVTLSSVSQQIQRELFTVFKKIPILTILNPYLSMW